MIDHINSQPPSSGSLQGSLPAAFSFIGDLAQRAGVSPMAIRFYEREGLLAPRRVGRFRTYNDDDERRLKSILRLRKIGLPIAIIRKALDIFVDPASPQNSKAAAKLLEDHFAELCSKRNEIARQINCTTGYLTELGVVIGGVMESPESNGSAAADSLENESMPPEDWTVR